MATKVGAPNIVVLAGPNGAGKSTVAPALLKGALRVDDFVNADTIAQGLSGFAPNAVALAAGRIMRGRLDELADARVDFAFETTLASRSLAAWLRKRVDTGHLVHLVFLWLPQAAQAVARVEARARGGGHSVPPSVVERRFHRGLRNMFERYLPLASTLRVYDNSGDAPRLVATERHGKARCRDTETWARIRESAHDG